MSRKVKAAAGEMRVSARDLYSRAALRSSDVDHRLELAPRKFRRERLSRHKTPGCPSIPYPTAIMTLKNRTLSPIAQLFIAGARETAKPLKST